MANRKKEGITSMLIDVFDRINIETPSNFDEILEFTYDDVCENADKENWDDGDVAIAFRRWIESNEKKQQPKPMSKRLIIYRLHDTTYGQGGNSKTLSVRLDEDNVFSYSYYGGWQDSGSGFSISNMQLKESLPMAPRNFKNVEELNKKIQSILKTGVGSSKVASFEILNDL